MNPYNSNTNNNNPSSDNESTAAKLAVIGGFLSTLGDVFSTYAAILALEEIQQSKNNNDDKINELEKQIKYLTKEINKQKRNKYE